MESLGRLWLSLVAPREPGPQPTIEKGLGFRVVGLGDCNSKHPKSIYEYRDPAVGMPLLDS